MYAIAHYYDRNNARVPTAGSMTAVVISDLRTVKGIWRRAINRDNSNGRGGLFAIEIGQHAENRYDAPDFVYVSRNDAHGFSNRLTRSYLPFLTLADEHNKRLTVNA